MNRSPDDGPVLDLDATDATDAGGPAERVPFSQVRVPLRVVAVVAVVVAAVAVWGTRAVDDDRVRREQSAALRLVVSVFPGTDLAGGGDYLTGSFTGALTVVNAGPLPVRITDVSSATAGLRISPAGPGPAVTVPAGEGRQVDVGVGVVCRAWARRVPVDLVMSVTTADGRRRAQRRSLDPGAWSDVLRRSCPAAF